jgi:hypothetical protein
VILDREDEPARCPVEWGGDRVAVFCRPHRCDLDEGHTGPHICNCGIRRRNMKRDWYPADETEDTHA